MADYMFMLESHLSAAQNRVVAEVRAAAGVTGMNVYLTGGVIRDVLGGFAVHDLEFRTEGDALRVAQIATESGGARILSADETRGVADLVFPGGVPVRIGTSGTIQEDLRSRDFTVNAIALSLNPASRGLLLDPANGLADLENRELRAVQPYTFYDDPVRLLRLIRFRVRLGFAVAARTKLQYDNARAAGMESRIPPGELLHELKQISEESAPSEILQALAEEGLLALYSSAFTGAEFNPIMMAKLEKAFRVAPGRLQFQRFGAFYQVLTENLTPKQQTELNRNIGVRKREVALWRTLDTRAKALGTALQSTRIRKPSQVYHHLSKASADEILFLLCHSKVRSVQDRIRNYFQRYLPLAEEFPKAELDNIPGKPGSPQYEKVREALLARHLDRRPRRPESTPRPSPPAEKIGGRRVTKS